MEIISKKNKLIKILVNEKKLGFVPTMGGIHEGHLSLIKESIRQNKKTVVSIFINKPQFNKKHDFTAYPRIIKKDISKLKKNKVDYLFLPSNKEIYPKGINKNITIDAFGKQLCGINRPSHFEAIADVIDRFLKIIKPNSIYFGEKDMQQFKIIQSFIQKNYKNIQVIGCKTIREKSGIAYSSRNFLLSKKDKDIASKVYHLINCNKEKILKRRISTTIIENIFYSIGVDKIDYIKVINLSKTTKPFKRKSIYKIFIAYYLKSVRLIDNI